MTDRIKEQLSAFLDGELPDPESALLLKRLERDDELRGALSRYSLIGAVLRSDGDVPVHLPWAPFGTYPFGSVPTDITLSSSSVAENQPAGTTVGTLAIGKPGAINAAIFAAEIVAQHRPEVKDRLRTFRQKRRDEVAAISLPAPSV